MLLIFLPRKTVWISAAVGYLLTNEHVRRGFARQSQIAQANQAHSVIYFPEEAHPSARGNPQHELTTSRRNVDPWIIGSINEAKPSL